MKCGITVQFTIAISHMTKSYSFTRTKIFKERPPPRCLLISYIDTSQMLFVISFFFNIININHLSNGNNQSLLPIISEI